MAPRSIIISGGSRGLGLGMVKHFLALGDRVATFSRSPSPEVRSLEADPALEGRLYYEPVDATDSAKLRAYVRSVYKRFGRIDGLVNNAGIARDGVLALMPEEDIEQMLDVNLRSALLLAKECSRFMLLQHGGTIINISSIIGERGFSGLAAYAATKAGMIGMTRALARELGSRNIRVNAVAPGYLETEMSQELSPRQREQIIRRTPLGRLGRIEDIVSVVEFLFSEASDFITGQVITVDGGATA